MNGLPAKHFAFGPYRAEQVGPSWWGVMNRDGFNCLMFSDKLGAVVTNEEHAKQIAAEWNEGAVFTYPPDTYVPPVTTRLTDEEMSAYVRSRVYKAFSK